MKDDVAAFVTQQTGRAVAVRSMQRLAGGASQEAWAVDLAFEEPPERLELVMRRDMGGALTFLALSRADEFSVLATAAAGGVAVPRPYFAPAVIAGKPAFFMERVAGDAVGRRIVTDPSFAPARALLPDQLAAQLARIHAIGLGGPGLPALPGSDAPSSAEFAVANLYRELDAVDEAHPALELALRYLARNAPSDAARTLLHGDFRIGNVLVDAASGLRAVLDWEFARAGDPHEDLAWFCVRAWRFGNDRAEAGGIASRERWLRAYEAAGGRAVDPARIAYFEILGNVRWAVGALMQARRHLSGSEPSIELASLGRVAAEMEFEALRLIERAG